MSGGDEKFNIVAQDGAADITSWAAGKWFHAIFSISSAEGARLILDNGTVVTDADKTAAPNGGDLVIGGLYDGMTTGLVGEIKEVVCGIDDLSEAEEADLYAGTLPGDETEYWPMDEGSGTGAGAIKDQQGTDDHDGAIDSACSWENVPQHQRSNGHYFDGFDDYEEIPASATQLNFTSGDFSFIFRAKTSDLTAANYLLSRGAFNVDGYGVLISATGRLQVYTYQDTPANQTSYSSAGAVVIDTLYTLGLSRSDDSINLYINGGVNTDVAGDHTNPTTCSRTSKLGIYEDKATQGFNGIIQDSFAYNRALSTAEHLYIHNKLKGRT